MSAEQGKRVATASAKTGLIAGGLAALLLAGIYGGLCGYAVSSHKFYPGQSIEGIEIGSLTKDDAIEKLQKELVSRPLSFLVDDEPEETVSIRDFGYSPSFHGENLDAMVQEVFPSYTSIGDYVTSGAEFLKSAMTHPNEDLVQWTVDDTVLSSASSAFAQDHSISEIPASHQYLGDKIELTLPKDGSKLDAAQVQEAVQEAVSSKSFQAVLTRASVSGGSLNPADIIASIESPCVNASYDAETDTIIKEQTGISVDSNQVSSILSSAQPGDTVQIPCTFTEPEVTEEALIPLLFRDVLGEAKTHVGGTSNRKSNVKLAVSMFDGMVMNPGDSFSYNQVVGKRTAERGFKPAPAYVQGETVDEIGGGICQGSSTLYLACLLANLQIDERYAHRYAPAYISWGMDATVSWGGPDYKFSNNTNYPIKLTATYADSYLTVRVLGTNPDGTYSKMTNKVLSDTAWTTVYQIDDSLEPGQLVEKTTPYTGHEVDSYHTIYDKDGNVLDSHFEAHSSYKVRNRVYLKCSDEKANAVVTPPVVTPVTPPVEVVPETPPVVTDPEIVETPASTPDAPPSSAEEDPGIVHDPLQA